MDANGLRSWMLADSTDWRFDVPDGDDVAYDSARRCLRLASRRPDLPSPTPRRSEALTFVERVPQTRDEHGTRAFWDGASGTVHAAGAINDGSSVPIFRPSGGNVPSDLALGYDGVLYMAIDGDIILFDLRHRWPTMTLQAPDFSAWRLAADPSGGVWVLDRENRHIGRLTGLPRPDLYRGHGADNIEPCDDNPDPPTLDVFNGQWLPDGETPIAIACSPDGILAVLSWAPESFAQVRYYFDGGWSMPSSLVDAPNPYSMAWLDVDHIAVMQHEVPNEVFVYPALLAGGEAFPVGDFYPLVDHIGEPFLNGVTLPPHYPNVHRHLPVGHPRRRGTMPLQRLSIQQYVTHGRAANAVPLDSGDDNTVWHRLYIEAVIPPDCGMQIRLAASNDEDASRIAPDDWYPHYVGQIFPASRRTPRAVWMSTPSEVPFYPGMMDCPLDPDHAGLFTVLIQRGTRRVTSLRGRYLHVMVRMIGNGLSTPELFAIRAYASRFSYIERYLPALYHESTYGTAAQTPIDESGSTTAPDFYERFLSNFEGVFTNIEDRVANAYLLTDPESAPEEALEWLGSWIGLSYDSAYPAEHRREFLQAAPRLYKFRGTLRGLEMALDVATGGLVDSHHILVIEDFRLRRTFSTILGADFEDMEDPLMPGLVRSGNSYVGDTLFLGEESMEEELLQLEAIVRFLKKITTLSVFAKVILKQLDEMLHRLSQKEDERKRFLALYNADSLDPRDEAMVREFLDSLAYQVTVIAQDNLPEETLRLIQRIIDQYVPAHVIARLELVDGSLVVGLASLIGVHTNLREEPPLQAVRLNTSQIGVRDIIRTPLSLDPRLEGGFFDLVDQEPPTAVPPETVVAEPGTTFTLDASESFAAPGRRIVRYVWLYLGLGN